VKQNNPKFDIIRKMNERKGLSPEHIEEVNHPSYTDFWEEKGITHEDRVTQLREMYSGDDKARQQLDLYDEHDNEYHQHNRRYIKALVSDDFEQQKELEQWFKTNYPDILTNKEDL